MNASAAAPVFSETPPGATAATPPADPAERSTETGTGTVPPLFSPDRGGGDTLGRDATAALLAELCTHKDAGTPFLVALNGGAGTGKSALLDSILGKVRGLSEAATAPFLARVVTARIEAIGGSDPAASILRGVFSALGSTYPALVEEAMAAGADPHEAARAASERVNDLRRQLDSERQTLDELSGRRARLAETVLFNAPGSRIDAYARTNRARIEGRLRAFGLPAGDPVTTYKDLVREAAETGDGASRTGLALRALWGFKGQATLLTLAVLLLVIGWGAAILAERQDAWVGWLSGFGDRLAGLTAWAQANAGWLAPISHAAFALAALAVLVDLVRAIRFLQPVFRGASLLGGDLDGRRRDLDGLLAHQTRRVDTLGTEVDAAVRAAEAAERRAEAQRSGGPASPAPGLTERDPALTPTADERAAGFLAGVGAAIGSGSGGAGAPGRLVVGIDGLDRLAPALAAGWLDAAHRLLGDRNMVTLAAFDRAHVLNGFAEADPALAAARLRRCVQLSYDLNAEAAAPAVSARRDGTGSSLDAPWQGYETALLDALARFTASPRARKALVNRYRVARADPHLADATPAERAGLAVALALDGTGAGVELPGLVAEGGNEAGGGASEAFSAASKALGAPVTGREARRGFAVARLYSQG